jgi:hypothetical protein
MGTSIEFNLSFSFTLLITILFGGSYRLIIGCRRYCITVFLSLYVQEVGDKKTPIYLEIEL